MKFKVLASVVSLLPSLSLSQPGCPISSTNLYCPFILSVGYETYIYSEPYGQRGVYRPYVPHLEPTIKPQLFNLTSSHLYLSGSLSVTGFQGTNIRAYLVPVEFKTESGLKQIMFATSPLILSTPGLEEIDIARWVETDWRECSDGRHELVLAGAAPADGSWEEVSRRGWEVCLRSDGNVNEIFARRKWEGNGVGRDECKNVELGIQMICRKGQ